MNIAFDMFFAKTDAMKRGIGRYSQNMIEAILKQDNAHSYFYFYPDISKGSEHLKNQLQQFLLRNRIDVYHMTSPFNLFHLPGHLFQAYSDAMLNKAWFGYTRVAATLYDVIPLVLEKQYMNDYVRPIYMRVIEMIRSCDIIYAISETTKQDAVRLAGMDPDKIKVVMGGYDPKFKPLSEPNTEEVKRRYAIAKPYVLCTGGDDPRKNISRLIEAFIAANRTFSERYQLVIVYKSTEDEKRHMLAQAAALGDATSLVVTGYVPDVDLVELYNGAELFAFPSLYEGFGLPIIEAMACGTPVLTSNNSSLGEISGDAAYLVDPESSSSIAEGIVATLGNPERLADLRRKGLKQSRQFTWESVADKVLEGYETSLRHRIAVFAAKHPCHPGRYGALHSAAPYLSDRCEIDVYVEKTEQHSKSKDQDYTLTTYSHETFESMKDKYDIVIYELGNDRAYEFIIPYLAYMWERPGIVVLGDANLHPLAWRTTIGRNAIVPYFRIMQNEFGLIAEQAMDRILSGEIDRKIVPIIRHYVHQSKAIVVHGRGASDRLTSLGYPIVVDAPIPAPPIVSAPRLYGSPLNLTSFVTQGGRLYAPFLLECLKELAEEGLRFKYRIIGQFSPEQLEEFKITVQNFGLTKKTEALSNLTPSRYEHWLKRTNVAIMLEDPELRSSPYAVYELVASGIPTIVYDVPAFEGLAQGVVTKVSTSGMEAAKTELKEAIRALCAGGAGGKEVREAMSKRSIEAFALDGAHTDAAFADAIYEAVVRSHYTGDVPTVQWHVQDSADGVPHVRRS
ncbi:glycosyltransferase family 4 protein [Cohnella soli]|uniref:Glycosyltransferase family 4 protein n=1 Tax=Cohnella soli TaxID=425005 RepID=A0ABW0HNB0_9BACL